MLRLNLIQVNYRGNLYSFKTIGNLKESLRCEIHPENVKLLNKASLEYKSTNIDILDGTLVIRD